MENYPLQRKLVMCESEIRTDITRFIKNYRGMGEAKSPPEEKIKEMALERFIKRIFNQPLT